MAYPSSIVVITEIYKSEAEVHKEHLLKLGYDKHTVLIKFRCINEFFSFLESKGITALESITAENPYEVPMRIYPAVHYTMGGLWVDYNLMSNVPGLHVLGEANFSDHGANRLGASALMQGLADGYFVIPYTLGDYLASNTLAKVTTDAPEFKQAEQDVKAGVSKLIKNSSQKSH